MITTTTTKNKHQKDNKHKLVWTLLLPIVAVFFDVVAVK